jgi:hypothetical protein
MHVIYSAATFCFDVDLKVHQCPEVQNLRKREPEMLETN